MIAERRKGRAELDARWLARTFPLSTPSRPNDARTRGTVGRSHGSRILALARRTRPFPHLAQLLPHWLTSLDRFRYSHPHAPPIPSLGHRLSLASVSSSTRTTRSFASSGFSSPLRLSLDRDREGDEAREMSLAKPEGMKGSRRSWRGDDRAMGKEGDGGKRARGLDGHGVGRIRRREREGDERVEEGCGWWRRNRRGEEKKGRAERRSVLSLARSASPRSIDATQDT